MAKKKVIKGTSGDDFIVGTESDESIYGGGGNDTIFGEGGLDWIYGEAGDDELSGAFDRDTLDGGTGNDSLSAAGVYIFGKGYGRDTITANHQTREPYDSFLSGTQVQFAKGIKPSDIQLDIVKVMIPQEDDDDAPQWNLELKIRGTQDVLVIEDYLFLDQGGRGEIRFSDGTSWFFDDVLAAVKNDPDLAQYRANNPPIPNYVGGSDGKDKLVGSGAGDQMDGGAGNDSMSGLGGKDTMYGGAGDDTLDGGDGDDYITAGEGKNVGIGGKGDDTINGGSGNDSLAGGDGDDLLFGAGGSDTLDGGSGDDTLLADGGANSRGVLNGGSGNDALYVGDGNHLLVGGAGDDYLEFIGKGNSTLQGGDGNDLLYAGLFEAGASTAIMDGGAGNDGMEGVFGSQTYLFDRGYGSDTVQARHYDSDVIVFGDPQFHKDDKVQFGKGVKPGDLSLDIVEESAPDIIDPSQTQTWWHLDLKIKGTSDRLRIQDYLTEQTGDRGAIQFADGTKWSYKDVVKLVKDDPEYQHFAASHTQADLLVDAMAAFGPEAGAESLATKPSAESNPILLAAA